MDLMNAMKARHSVRSYTDRAIEGEVREQLEQCIAQCNAESGMHMQLVADEPQAFDGFMAHYGNFRGVKNYIAVVGKKGKGAEEKSGYYAEKVVLTAQALGLNTCWVAMSYSKRKTEIEIAAGEKLFLVIAIGYGATQGIAHRSKQREQVMKVEGNPPQWFLDGVDAALLAPTAMNQQAFTFVLGDGNRVIAKSGVGFYTKTDLGIAKLHFELGAGKDNFRWE